MNAQQLYTAPTQEALFQDLVLEAEHDAHIELPHELEAHLVYLMIRYLHGSMRLNGAIALQFMEAAGKRGTARIEALNDTGDVCLLLAELFPEQARHRMVSAGYFARIGCDCYRFLAGATMATRAEMYQHLCDGFGDMLGVLRTMHHYDCHEWDNSMMDAYDLWQQTACPTAFAELCAAHGSTPMRQEQQYIL